MGKKAGSNEKCGGRSSLCWASLGGPWQGTDAFADAIPDPKGEYLLEGDNHSDQRTGDGYQEVAEDDEALPLPRRG